MFPGNTSPPVPAPRTASAAAITLVSLRRLATKSRRNSRRGIGFVDALMVEMLLIKKMVFSLSMLLLREVRVLFCFPLFSFVDPLGFFAVDSF